MKEINELINSVNNEEIRQLYSMLDERGYVTFKAPESIIKQIPQFRKTIDEILYDEGTDGGWEGREEFKKPGKEFDPGSHRIGILVEKSDIFRQLLVVPQYLALAKKFLGGEFKIGSIDYREPKKMSGEQPLHIDWLPLEKNFKHYGCLSTWFYIDDASIDNGATRVIPGSHKKFGWPDEYINVNERQENEIRLEVESGTMVVLCMNTWHAGAINLSGKRRRSVVIDFRSRDLPQLVNLKRYLSQRTIKNLNEVERYLLSVRDCDEDQGNNGVGPGAYYRQKYGHARTDLSTKFKDIRKGE